VSPIPRPRSSFPWATLVVVVLVLVAAAATAWLMDLLAPVGLHAPGKTAQRRGPVIVEGMTQVPIAPRAIPAYTKITRDHLFDPATGTFGFINLPPDQVAPDVVRTVPEIFGRVLASNKPAGYVFTERDFLPRGTRPGLAAGIPAGRRAIRIQAEKVKGVFGLEPGDHIDIVASVKIGAAAVGAAPAATGPYAWQIDAAARLAAARGQAAVTTVVSNGIVVAAVENRQVPTTSASLTSGLTVRTRPVQEIVLAVRPEEVGPLMEALTLDADLACLPRSGRPDEASDERTPDLVPASPFSALDANAPAGARRLDLVERIEGRTREMVPVPCAAEHAPVKPTEAR